MASNDMNGLSGLRSDKSVQRLRQISALRSRGIGENIDLPQLVVCGDQSAGKSSVLEGLSSIPFPRDEGVCTKFATEVILEHTEGEKNISATIIPHASRNDASKVKLQAFQRNIKDFDELPDVIASAGELMGLRGYGDNESGPSFVEDVLRIKYSGPTGLHLSIVDLPGLIATASEEQSEDDVETVQRMVNSYVQNPRTIILAVVQANNDIANQSIIKKSKQYDQAGVRTVGIITKPDLINATAEIRIAALAKNQDTTRLKLGFFLLKNPTPVEVANGITLGQRSANELRFFQSSPWKEQKLDSSRVGIEKLRDFSQKLLDQHIEKEFPKVREEIKVLIRTTEQEIVQLPKERPTVGHLRMYLAELAMQYHSLAGSALSGDYHTINSAFFLSEGDGPGPTRLRALVHDSNTKFRTSMDRYGRTLKLGKGGEDQPPSSTYSGTADLGVDWYSRMMQGIDQEGDAASFTDALKENQEYVTESEQRAWVKKTYVKSRGRELPGNYNNVLLTELFHQQSRKWPHIAAAHVKDTARHIHVFVNKAIESLEIEEHVEAGIREGIDAQLEESEQLAEAELEKLCEDESQQPITYNHYYTDNVQKARLHVLQQSLENVVGKAAKESDYSNTVHMAPDMLIATLQKQLNFDMDDQACTEALAGLNAYYKVALKTFVDNVCRQVVERHLLRTLPKIFSPQRVVGYTDEELERLAGEQPDVVEKRKQLHEQVVNLKAGLNDLRK